MGKKKTLLHDWAIPNLGHRAQIYAAWQEHCLWQPVYYGCWMCICGDGTFRAYVMRISYPIQQVNRGFIMHKAWWLDGWQYRPPLPLADEKCFHVTANTAGGATSRLMWSRITYGAFFLSSAVFIYSFYNSEYRLQILISGTKQIIRRRRFGWNFFMPFQYAIPDESCSLQVQFFTWPRLFPDVVLYNGCWGEYIGGNPDSKWPGILNERRRLWQAPLSFYSVVTLLFSFVLPSIADNLDVNLHTICLLCGALGLISVSWIHDKYLLSAPW